jgi:hypothetical protein
MTDLEEVPEDPTPLSYERLPNLQPKPEDKTKELSEDGLAKVFNVMDPESQPRKGGLRD